MHSDHNNSISLQTDQEIVKDSEQLIELSAAAIETISKNMDNLYKIVSKSKEISSDELILYIMEAINFFGQPIL